MVTFSVTINLSSETGPEIPNICGNLDQREKPIVKHKRLRAIGEEYIQHVSGIIREEYKHARSEPKAHKFTRKSLPKPMAEPHTSHLLDWDTLHLRQEKINKTSHHHHPHRKEEKNATFHATKHNQKGLCDQEGEDETHGNSNTLTC
ncbi:unnamed protein product [Victoria cruziana]